MTVEWQQFTTHAIDQESARQCQNVAFERFRQDIKWGNQRHLPPDRWNTILVEEVGEVSKAINEREWENLAVELIQVAAVCVAWAEDIAKTAAEKEMET